MPHNPNTALVSPHAQLPEEVFHPLKRLNRVYFSNPDNILELAEGDCLMSEGETSHRIYLVLKGTLVAYRRNEPLETNIPDDSDGKGHEVFRATFGSYVGVQSFFSRTFRASSSIYATEPTELAWIDDSTPPQDEEEYGSFEHQFIPVLVYELAVRNSRILSHVVEKEEAVRLLQRAEMAATLGQLSAGIAHELNNAISVITRRTEFVARDLADYLSSDNKENSQTFLLGYENNTFCGAEELRPIAREYEKKFDLSQAAARVLARIAPTDSELKKIDSKFIKHLERNYRFWEIGHDLRDMQLAARHAAGIVRAVKLLGGGKPSRDPGTDVVQSINDALSLLESRLKLISVKKDLQPVPAITADMTDLIQLWTNIVKNALDAMSQAETPNPEITLSTRVYNTEGSGDLLPTEYICVTISNNGPPIPEEIQSKIFQPNFTTKKRGLDFGLGLGLSIVRHVTDSYNGTIELESKPGNTSFNIHIPTTQIHGND